MKGFFILGINILVLFLFAEQPSAQQSEQLHIYGFTQVAFISRTTDYTVFKSAGVPIDYSASFRSNTFSLQQINLFFQKPISEKSMFFLNLEASGSYSSKLPSGYLEIPEGWISYQINDEFELKAGLLLPSFNNLNEIQNRLPLFPYLLRPIIYESLVGNVVSSEDYRPDKAFIQLSYNQFITNQYMVDASFYVGNSEGSFLATKREFDNSDQNTEQRARIYLGENMNTALLYGGRVGIENVFNTFKFGISATIDEDNRTIEQNSLYGLPSLTTPILGEIRRYRVGVDLSFEFFEKFQFEGEYMSAFHDHSSLRSVNQFKNANLNKYFYYINFSYSLNSQSFIYSRYSLTKDFSYDFVVPDSPDAAGLHGYSVGLGWKPLDETMIKFQIFQGRLGNTPTMEYVANFITLGVSTIF